mmetsp:Transcript_9761/g.21162  ORF Transcript_9761/g.21162 Transcript_9761/m.21162 type:complete len:82 (+) Transcript_9761:1472-1717(+)
MLVRSAQLTLGRLIFLTVGFIGCGAVVAALGQWLQSFSSLSFLARGIQTKQYDDAPLYDQFINDHYWLGLGMAGKVGKANL